MSEATRKFAAIVCAELAGKVDVNDFRNGSTTEVQRGLRNVRSWGQSRHQFRAAGCLLLANSRSQRRLLSRQPQGTRVVNLPLVFRDLDLSDKRTVHHFNPNLSSRLYHAPNERLIRFTDQTRNRSTTDTRLRWRNAEVVGLRGDVSYAVAELTPNHHLLQGRSINVRLRSRSRFGLCSLFSGAA